MIQIINMFVWTLLLLNICIFIMCIMILRIRPKMMPPKGNYHSIIHPYEESSKELDYTLFIQREQQQIKICYPEIPILFQEVPCSKAYILRFKGLSKNDKHVLYVFHHESAKGAFLSAIEKMVENGDTPFYNIIIAIVYDNHSNEEVLKATEGYRLKYIFDDESEMRNLPETEGSSAFVGVGVKPYAILNITNENDDHEWLSTLNSYQLFDPLFTNVSKQACLQLKDTMPFYTRFSLLLTPLFNHSLMYQYMMKYPETMSWFLPVLDKEDKKIVVYSPSEESLNESINKISESALKQHIVVEEESREIQMHTLQEDSDYFENIKDIIHSTLHTEYELPVLIENYCVWNTNVPVISFAPLQQGQVSNLYYAINFYTQLLMRQK